MITGTYVLTSLCCVGLSVMDRLILKRRAVDIISIEQATSTEQYVRFVLNFKIKHKLQNATITYTLRDRKNPATVIAGKDRTLEFSEVGVNSEYLLFNKKLVSDGDWVLDLKVVSSGSRINPLYKLFPIITTIKKEFFLNETRI
ncbi:hypothetical protein I3271_05715 [Photobacterium leiognathi]|uniref:hypothetical protein n=1 Tax=Photobacterium leiognathi TaxID=553611 RepID=UPI001EDF7AFA|nr:hypothetical protein [Photobacterium leiognathi]MCG3884179.1 hypothetical protein [Photobacterium leiognathi]